MLLSKSLKTQKCRRASLLPSTIGIDFNRMQEPITCLLYEHD